MKTIELCPHCQKEIEIDASLSGREIICPHCQGPAIAPVFELPADACVQRPPAAPPARSHPPQGFICPTCGTVGKPVLITPGSLMVELALWLLLLLPGLIYSVWRHATRHEGCGKCGAQVISLDTPRGIALWRELKP